MSDDLAELYAAHSPMRIEDGDLVITAWGVTVDDGVLTTNLDIERDGEPFEVSNPVTTPVGSVIVSDPTVRSGKREDPLEALKNTLFHTACILVGESRIPANATMTTRWGT